VNKLSSRKLWLAALTSFLLVHLSACLFTVGTVWSGHDLAAVLIAAALTVLGYVRDITVAYLGANAIGHVVGALEANLNRRREDVTEC
jgi:hypothetical protein